VKDYAYVEVMACPGGCTNGGGQVKVQEVEDVRAQQGLQLTNGDVPAPKPGPKEQKEWLGRVDEAYFSGSDSEDARADADGDKEMRDAETNRHTTVDDSINGISTTKINDIVAHWSQITGVDTQKLLYTSFRKVESDVGKKVSDMERVAGLAVTVGGGW
jgi:hypothetical protein